MDSKRSVTIAKINIVARHFEESLAFYRLLGLDFPDPSTEPADVHHAVAQNGDTDFAIDNDALARIYNAGWRAGSPTQSVLITAQCGARADVDATYEKMTAAGYTAIQPPFDAFWGSRFAIIADPEGNAVGLESPSDAAHRSWPPPPSPDLP